MALWLVRAGKYGEREELALESGNAVVGWQELPDLSSITDRDALKRLLAKVYPNEKPKRLLNWESQLWPIINTIQPGDLLVLPLKSRAMIAVGRVTGPYKYRTDLEKQGLHTRPVKWLKELPRSVFDKDLLYSFGAFMTVCRIQRGEAEERVRALLEDRVPHTPEPDADESTDYTAPPDLEQNARDQIREYIGQKFKGHDLAALVAALLEAQGYKLNVSPEGPDGGIDIICGRGALGFEAPRLAVQVKSGDSPVDVKVLRELQGVMKNFGADQGLVVAWGGYRQSVPREATRLFFEIRLWDSNDLIDMIQAHYDELPESFRSALPLKRIWTLVLADE
jgi:restriction system protein